MASRRQNLLLPFSFSFRYPYLIVIPMHDSSMYVCHARTIFFCCFQEWTLRWELFMLSSSFDFKWHARRSTLNVQFFFLFPCSYLFLLSAISFYSLFWLTANGWKWRNSFENKKIINDKFIKRCNTVPMSHFN